MEDGVFNVFFCDKTKPVCVLYRKERWSYTQLKGKRKDGDDTLDLKKADTKRSSFTVHGRSKEEH